MHAPSVEQSVTLTICTHYNHIMHQLSLVPIHAHVQTLKDTSSPTDAKQAIQQENKTLAFLAILVMHG